MESRSQSSHKSWSMYTVVYSDLLFSSTFARRRHRSQLACKSSQFPKGLSARVHPSLSGASQQVWTGVDSPPHSLARSLMRFVQILRFLGEGVLGIMDRFPRHQFKNALKLDT